MKLLADTNVELKIDKSKKYLLACSCGPDSFALLSMLYNQGFNFGVAFVNYQTRTNSDNEEITITKYCKNLNIPIYVAKTKIVGSDFENKARVFRYDFFAKICKNYGYFAILTAHHADDSLETFYFHKQRESFTKYLGIAGFSEYKTVVILRPLLCYEKKTLLNYCIENNLPYSIDYTNLQDDHTRNIIRHTIVEKLSVEEKEKTLTEIEETNNKLNQIYKFCRVYKQNVEIPNKEIMDMDEFYALHALYFIVSNFTKLQISGKLIKEIYKDMKEQKQNIFYSISPNFFFVLEYVSSRIISVKSTQYRLNMSLTEAYKKLGFNPLNLNNDNAYKVISLVDAEKFIQNNRKININRFLINCKIPATFRHLWPCVVDANNTAIYSPRYRHDYEKKPTDVFDFDINDLLIIANK